MNDKHLSLYVTIVVAVITGLGAQWLRSWHEERAQQLRTQMQSEQEVNQLLARISHLQESIRQYEDRMPITEDTSWLVDLVTQLADEQWIQVRSVEPQAPQDKGIYTKLGVRVGVRCGYHALGDFVSGLEGYQKFLMIEQCQIDMKDQQVAIVEDPVIDAQLLISTASPKS